MSGNDDTDVTDVTKLIVFRFMGNLPKKNFKTTSFSSFIRDPVLLNSSSNRLADLVKKNAKLFMQFEKVDNYMCHIYSLKLSTVEFFKFCIEMNI